MLQLLLAAPSSGSGKTTAATLIPRFWDVQEGSITIGGHDVKEFTCDSLLKNMSMVFQNVYLFKDTIENNIKFGCPEASHEQVVEAAKKARCHDFISLLPEGYNTMIEEGGSTLSGGEKQRVAIGSAIASDKKLLIFDEPTSGLDYRHMLEVSDNLNRLKEMGKSLFLITHDPELIYKCCTYLLFIQGSKVLWHRPMDGEAVKLLRAFFSHEQETGAVNAS